MNVFPIHTDTPASRHWVVRWLRYTGYMEVIAAVILGVYYSAVFLAPRIQFQLNLDMNVCILIAALFGGFIAFVAGLGISLPAWALALVIDDLHALRLYNQGYVITDDRKRD